MATDDYAKIEHDMAAMLRESFPVTSPPGLATKLSLQKTMYTTYKTQVLVDVAFELTEYFENEME